MTATRKNYFFSWLLCFLKTRCKCCEKYTKKRQNVTFTDSPSPPLLLMLFLHFFVFVAVVKTPSSLNAKFFFVSVFSAVFFLCCTFAFCQTMTGIISCRRKCMSYKNNNNGDNDNKKNAVNSVNSFTLPKTVAPTKMLWIMFRKMNVLGVDVVVVAIVVVAVDEAEWHK